MFRYFLISNTHSSTETVLYEYICIFVPTVLGYALIWVYLFCSFSLVYETVTIFGPPVHH